MPVVIALALLLHTPALFSGFFMDDYGQQIVLRGIAQDAHMKPWNLYDFGAARSETSGEVMRDTGLYPWWTSPDWRGRFFRPLTSMTLWLDHAIYGDWAVGYHLTSLVWFIVLLCLVDRLYRNVGLSPRLSLLAVLILVCSGSTVFPVNWPANRNALVSLTFLLAALVVLTRRSARGSWGALVSAWGLGVAACLGKESGIVTFALIALYLIGQWAGAGDRRLRRWIRWGVAGSVGLATAYLVLYIAAGYGTTTIFYRTPWDQPLGYVSNLAVLLTLGLLGLLTPLTLELRMFGNVWWFALASLPLIALLAWLSWRRLRGQGLRWFWLGWIAVAILPQAIPPPSDRLLMTTAVATSALLAMFLREVLGGKRAGGRLDRVLGYGLVGTAMVLSGLLLPLTALSVNQISDSTRRLILTADVGAAGLGRRDAIILQSPSQFAPIAARATWVCESNDREVRFWPMQLSRCGLSWTRIDDRTFDLAPLRGEMLDIEMERVFRTSDTPLAAGTVRRTALMSVEVMETGTKGVKRIRVQLPDSLDHPGYRFLVADDDGKREFWRRIEPPAVGGTIEIAAYEPLRPFTP